MQFLPLQPDDPSPEKQPTPQRTKVADPTPEEIAAACENIRASWTEDEKRERTMGIASSSTETDD
jgi:hypothetical protein